MSHCIELSCALSAFFGGDALLGELRLDTPARVPQGLLGAVTFIGAVVSVAWAPKPAG